jgi:hypothetical protein
MLAPVPFDDGEAGCTGHRGRGHKGERSRQGEQGSG